MSGHSLTAAGTIYPELQYTPTDFLVVNSLELGTLTGEPTPEAPFVSLIDPPNYASPGSSVKSDKASSVDSGIFAPIKQLRLLTQRSLPAVPNIPECRAAQATLSLTNTERRQILDSEDDHLLNVPEVNFSKSKLLKSNTSRTSAAQCRICFSASGDTLVNGVEPVLVHPCACDGSIRFCHPECLLQWVRQSGSFVCELCKTRYRIKRSGLNKCTQWSMPTTDSIDWIHMIIFFFSVCFIVGSIVWMAWLGLGHRLSGHPDRDPLAHHSHSRNHEPDGTGTLGDFMVPAFILYSIIDVLFLFIAGMELIFTISPLVGRWYRMNQKLIIENHDGRIMALPRHVDANVIAPSTVAVLPNTLSLRASIPCVNEERERIVLEQSSML